MCVYRMTKLYEILSVAVLLFGVIFCQTNTTTKASTTTTASATTMTTTTAATTKYPCDISCESVGIACLSNGTCVCSLGYTGEFCNIRIPCTDDCLYGGVCNNGSCTCLNGFFGARCESYYGSCNSSLCKNGGTCGNKTSGPCNCSSQYSGVFCENYIGCQAGDSFSCTNNGTCLSTGYCKCTNGYTGTTCQNYIGCQAGSSLSCLNEGTCLSTGVCQCKSGFNGTTCEITVGTNSVNVNLIVGVTVSVVLFVIIVIIVIIVVYKFYGDRILNKFKANKYAKKVEGDARQQPVSASSPISLTRRVGDNGVGTYIYFEDENGAKYYLDPNKEASKTIANRQSLHLTPEEAQIYFYEDSSVLFAHQSMANDPNHEYYTVQVDERFV